MKNTTHNENKEKTESLFIQLNQKQFHFTGDLNPQTLQGIVAFLLVQIGKEKFSTFLNRYQWDKQHAFSVTVVWDKTHHITGCTFSPVVTEDNKYLVALGVSLAYEKMIQNKSKISSS